MAKKYKCPMCGTEMETMGTHGDMHPMEKSKSETKVSMVEETAEGEMPKEIKSISDIKKARQAKKKA